jgi:ATP-dependent Clp protease ATP-binding subunit ClpC
MFERYTERARRVIFFARYEASQLGSNSIETEHLLLGLIREGKGLTSRIFSKSHLSMESIRKEIEGRALYRDKVSTSVDIPLSAESKRVLGYASEEAERMLHNYIGTEHILLGLMREDKSVAAGILGEKGMRLGSVREDIVALLNEKASVGKTKETPLLSEFSRDLTEAAARGLLDPLVGRDDELDRIIQVLCRRTRNNPVLIGEPGVGRPRSWRASPTRSCRGTSPSTSPTSGSSPSTSPSSWPGRNTGGSSRSASRRSCESSPRATTSSSSSTSSTPSWGRAPPRAASTPPTS